MIALDGGEGGPQEADIRDACEGSVTLVAEPEQCVGGQGVFADGAVEGGAEFLGLALVEEQLRGLGDDAQFSAEHEGDGFGRPIFAVGRGDFREDALHFRGGDVGDERGKIALLLVENAADRGSVRAESEVGNSLDEFVPGKQNAERVAGVEFRALLRRVVHGDDDGAELRRGVGELGEVFDDEVEGLDLMLHLPGVFEGREVFVGVGNRALAQFERHAFLGRDREVTVNLEGFFRGFDPAFEFRLDEHVGDEDAGDLLLRCFPAKAVQNGPHQPDRIAFHLRFDAREVGRLLREDMVGRDDGEGFRGVLKLHRVALLSAEIDGHLRDQEIERSDLAEAPAFMRDVGAGRQLGERSGGGRGEFCGFDGLLNFGLHRIGVGNV